MQLCRGRKGAFFAICIALSLNAAWSSMELGSCNIDSLCNNGICEDGECVCLPGWGGTYCDITLSTCERTSQGLCRNVPIIPEHRKTSLLSKHLLTRIQQKSLVSGAFEHSLRSTWSPRRLDAASSLISALTGANDTNSSSTFNFSLAIGNGTISFNSSWNSSGNSTSCDLLCGSHGRVNSTTCQCVCDQGWEGIFCDRKNASSVCFGCGLHGSCSSASSSCECELGWTGRYCDQRCFDCNASAAVVCGASCGLHGHCAGNGSCVCASGWEGLYCNIFVEPICNGCVNGQCQSGACICDKGWTGVYCNETYAATCRKDCGAHGLCVQGQCVCDCDWTGETCAVPISLSTCTGCGPRYNCNMGKCVCQAEYENENCQQMRCKRLCGQHGTCMNNTCVCDVGWGGLWCEHKVTYPPCVNNCNGHGVCLNGLCQCYKGYEGLACQTAKIAKCTGYNQFNQSMCMIAPSHTGERCVPQMSYSFNNTGYLSIQMTSCAEANTSYIMDFDSFDSPDRLTVCGQLQNVSNATATPAVSMRWNYSLTTLMTTCTTRMGTPVLQRVASSLRNSTLLTFCTSIYWTLASTILNSNLQDDMAVTTYQYRLCLLVDPIQKAAVSTMTRNVDSVLSLAEIHHFPQDQYQFVIELATKVVSPNLYDSCQLTFAEQRLLPASTAWSLAWTSPCISLSKDGSCVQRWEFRSALLDSTDLFKSLNGFYSMLFGIYCNFRSECAFYPQPIKTDIDIQTPVSSDLYGPWARYTLGCQVSSQLNQQISTTEFPVGSTVSVTVFLAKAETDSQCRYRVEISNVWICQTAKSSANATMALPCTSLQMLNQTAIQLVNDTTGTGSFRGSAAQPGVVVEVFGSGSHWNRCTTGFSFLLSPDLFPEALQNESTQYTIQVAVALFNTTTTLPVGVGTQASPLVYILDVTNEFPFTGYTVGTIVAISIGGLAGAAAVAGTVLTFLKRNVDPSFGRFW